MPVSRRSSLTSPRPFRQLVAAALAVLVLAVPAAAQHSTIAITLQDTARTARPAEAEALLERARVQGSLPVIVGFDQPVALEGTLGAAAIDGQRAAIAARQAALVASLAAPANLRLYEAIPYFAARLDLADLERLLAMPGVTSITEDIALPPVLNNSVPHIQVPTVWRRGFRGTGFNVAVLDTGIRRNHNAFTGRITAEACFSTPSPGVSASFCPGGAAVAVGPGAAADCPMAVAGCGHGTHVAGIAAGRRTNRIGVARDAGIIPIQVFSRFPGAADCGAAGAPCALSYQSDQLAGLNHVITLAATMPIAAVNMSIGGGQHASHCDTDPLKAAIDQLRSLGIATVIASGNNGFNGSVSAPGCISSAVTVGSTTIADAVSDFSNHAALVDLMAPGSNISAPYPVGGRNAVATLSGTSMATPHVAGTFALLRQARPEASVDQILAALQCTGTPVTRANQLRPRIDVLAALGFLRRTNLERIWNFRNERQFADWTQHAGLWFRLDNQLQVVANGATSWHVATSPFCVRLSSGLDVTVTMRRFDPDNRFDWDSGIFLMSGIDSARNISGLMFLYNMGVTRNGSHNFVTVYHVNRFNIDTNRGSVRVVCEEEDVRGLSFQGFNRLRVVGRAGRLRFSINGTLFCNVPDPGVFTPLAVAVVMAAPGNAAIDDGHILQVSRVEARLSAEAAGAALEPAAVAIEPGREATLRGFTRREP